MSDCGGDPSQARTAADSPAPRHPEPPRGAPSGSCASADRQENVPKISAFAASAKRAWRKILPLRNAAAALQASVTRRGRATVIWVEDHAEPLIATTGAVLVAVIVTLLLWKTANVINLAREFQPVLSAIAALTTTLLGAIRVLKWRRDQRQKKSASRVP